MRECGPTPPVLRSRCCGASPRARGAPGGCSLCPRVAVVPAHCPGVSRAGRCCGDVPAAPGHASVHPPKLLGEPAQPAESARRPRTLATPEPDAAQGLPGSSRRCGSSSFFCGFLLYFILLKGALSKWFASVLRRGTWPDRGSQQPWYPGPVLRRRPGPARPTRWRRRRDEREEPACPRT